MKSVKSLLYCLSCLTTLTRHKGAAPVLSEVVQAATVGSEGCSVRVTNGSDDVNILEWDLSHHARSGVGPSLTQTGECLVVPVLALYGVTEWCIMRGGRDWARTDPAVFIFIFPLARQRRESNNRNIQERNLIVLLHQTTAGHWVMKYL